jgi:hypothetical protein
MRQWFDRIPVTRQKGGLGRMCCIAGGTMALREQLAELAHAQWAGWMVYLFSKSAHNPDGSITIPPDLAMRWKRQADTSYTDLPENEKESDREEADRYLELIR